ncbi:MAG TPA: hypothetical protein VKZ95_06260 [Sphingobacteriaceae bacterium]|nr:hypothetical protein [Sphingobacteriaceae bacterium]
MNFTDSKYKEFRRIYPVPRLSYSLYKYWIKNDWYEVWNYLAGFQYYKSSAMTLGSEGHEWIQKNGVPKWLAEMVDNEKVHIEEKLTWGIDIDNPSKVLRDEEKELEYCVVIIPDVRSEFTYIVDWKFGGIAGYEKQLSQYSWIGKKIFGEDKYNRNIVIGVEAIRDENGCIKELRKVKSHEYETNPKFVKEWDLVFDEMNNSIRRGLDNGEFDDFLKFNYF